MLHAVFAPIIVVTVAPGIARMENMKELGRVGLRALAYFAATASSVRSATRSSPDRR